MTSIKSLLTFAAAILFTFTACQKEEIYNETDLAFTESSTKNIDGRTSEEDNTLIVLSAPSIHNEYYAAAFDDIIDYLAHFAEEVEGKDEVLILVDADTRPYFDGLVAPGQLMTTNVEDIWIRDFGTVIPGRNVKFNYLPDFQDASTSNLIDNSFERWFRNAGLKYGKKSRLILDGGNVVDNAAGTRVILTDRFLYDNPQLTYASAKRKLKKLLGVQQVALISEFPGDATGHSDGMVMWATDNKILLHEMPKRLQRKVIRELKRSFPGVEIVVVPDYYKDETWQGFSSACNIFVNSLVTDDYIYMPTFDSSHDAQMLQLIQSNTDKTVVPIAAEGVCFMGGSVRCLSMQLKGENKDILMEE